MKLTPSDVARQRFRDFSAHVRETRCCDSVRAYRVYPKFQTIVYCPCNEEWIFTDVALRDAPQILDYFRTCGLEREIVQPILDHHPVRTSWAKVLLGFLDEGSV